MRPLFLIALIGAAFISISGPVVHASTKPAGRVEVIEVTGIIDGSVERAVIGGITEAEKEHATLVVLEIDSPGTIDVARTNRLVARIGDARVPVATWIGPAGASAADGAAPIALSGHLRAMAPGTSLGHGQTLDLRRRLIAPARPTVIAARDALTQKLIDVIEPSLSDVLRAFDGKRVDFQGGAATVASDPDRSQVRLHGLDLFGRMLHAAAKPSIAYLLLLLGLVGVVFEAFHPSTGPAGVSGLAALALSGYGIVTLGGSWLGVVLIVAGVIAFCVDLRFASLGVFTAIGFAALVAGSILLFHGPWLRTSPWVLAFGVAAMVAFLLGAMTRVLRDLRALARGEIEVQDPHPHPNGHGEAHAP